MGWLDAYAARAITTHALPAGLLCAGAGGESDQANEVRPEIRPHIGCIITGQLRPSAADRCSVCLAPATAQTGFARYFSGQCATQNNHSLVVQDCRAGQTV